MEKRISTLIFCKDGIENVVNLINEIYGISEEIIVIDSSTPKNKEILAEEKNKENMEKVYISCYRTWSSRTFKCMDSANAIMNGYFI